MSNIVRKFDENSYLKNILASNRSLFFFPVLRNHYEMFLETSYPSNPKFLNAACPRNAFSNP